jgi:hypothetical protein
MPRKKEAGVIARWTICQARSPEGKPLIAHICIHGDVVDVVAVTSTTHALASVAHDYMSRLAPSKKILEARRKRFADELDRNLGICPNDCGNDKEHDINLALHIRDADWSLVMGTRDYVEWIAEKYDLQFKSDMV